MSARYSVPLALLQQKVAPAPPLPSPLIYPRNKQLYVYTTFYFKKKAGFHKCSSFCSRCGRLSYFIPFPLSVTLPGRHPVVEEALNTTYYASPCGDFCPQDPSATPHRSSPHEHQQVVDPTLDVGGRICTLFDHRLIT